MCHQNPLTVSSNPIDIHFLTSPDSYVFVSSSCDVETPQQLRHSQEQIPLGKVDSRTQHSTRSIPIAIPRSEVSCKFGYELSNPKIAVMHKLPDFSLYIAIIHDE